MIRILYDFQAFTYQDYGGVSKYFTELLSRLKEQRTVQVILPFFFTNNTHFLQRRLENYPSFFPYLEFKGKRKLQYIINRKLSQKFLQKGDYDIFHPTYYDPYYTDSLRNAPFILTVYDLIDKIFPNKHPKSQILIKRMDEIIPRADKIIAISESTKNDLIRIYNIPSNRIHTIHLGYSNYSDSPRIKIKDLPGEYILYVGKRGEYKNFNFMIEALAPLLRIKNLNIVCAGGGKFDDNEIRILKDLEVTDRAFYISIMDDSEMVNYYKHALLYILPSLYEGFGLPILEAFSCNCPVAASNISSIPEVAQSGAVYFDPYNKKSIYECIKELLENSTLQKQLRRQGSNELKRFSWEETARATCDVYRLF